MAAQDPSTSKLYLSPKHTGKSTPKSPLFRRHHSEPAIDITTLNLDEEERKREAEQQDLEQTDTEHTIDSNAKTTATLDLSSFSTDDALKFSEELQKAIDSIKSRKELPAPHIVSGVLDALEFWMKNHGLKALTDVAEEKEKYDAMVLRSEKEKEMLSSMIEEYKAECHEHQSRRESFDSKTEELQRKLTEATQQLENVQFVQQQIDELRHALDSKEREHQKSLKTQIAQQKSINELKEEQIQLQQIIDSQKAKLAKMKQIESELKSQVAENKELNKKYKENERRLKRVSNEKESAVQDKKAMQTKLTDYGKLQDNLKQYKANEEHYQRMMDELKQENMRLLDEMEQFSQQTERPISPRLQRQQSKEFVLEHQMQMQPQIVVNGKEHTFVQFVNQTQSYNMSPPPFVKKMKTEQTALAPLYDQHELEKMRQEFDIAKQGALGRATGNDGENAGDDKSKKNGTSRYGYHLFYRSFILVGVSCLCYLAYSQYYHGSSLHKAKQIRDKYKKWQQQINMKKRVIDKQAFVK